MLPVTLTSLDIQAYLRRLGYNGPLNVSAETLRDLHLAHLYTIPFENLDIHLGHPIVLEEAALFQKIVNRRRGGFCYELNGLFGALLRDLGFRVTLISAEVAQHAGGFSPPYDHLALRVDLEEPWLADVGFGEGFRLPVRLNETSDQVQGDSACLLVHEGDYWILLRRKAGGDWAPQYRFTLAEHEFAEFEERCRYHQSSPESHFTKDRLCTLATPEGRVTLSGMRLITTTGAGRKEQQLKTEAEYAAALSERFAVIE